MSTVLYEIDSGYLAIFLVPILILVAIPFYPKLSAKFAENSGEKYTAEDRHNDIGMSMIAWTVVFLFALIGYVGQSAMYDAAITAWESHDYKIVEGYVENYSFPTPGTRVYESFDLNGVHFEYSSTNMVPSYHKTAKDGGVITGNGQYLKIGYIYYNSAYGNLIIYIEQLPPPDSSN